MNRKFKQIISLMLAMVICVGFAVVSTAYADNYPNTHRNTGRNIADLISVARTQLGYTELNTTTGMPLSSSEDGGYTKYGASFGNPTGAWCAYFVSWCATQAGIPTSVVPRLGNCAAAVSWYKSHSRFCGGDSDYTPKTGDIIFFNWSGGSTAKHIGIITGVSGNTIYTIEGNTDSSLGFRCAGKVRSRTAGYIVGYGVPAYNDAETTYGSYSFASVVSGSLKSGSVAYSTAKLAVVTTGATGITCTNAILNGSVTNSGRYFISSVGFMFGTDKLKMKKYSVGGGSTKKEIEVSMDAANKIGEDLKPKTTYYYQTYVTIDGRDYLGPTYCVITINDKPQKVIISEDEANVGVGEELTLVAVQIPFSSIDKGMTWKSDNEKIATVENGLVTGVDYGKTTITATANNGGISNTCEVSVLIPTPKNVKIINSAKEEITLSWDEVPDAKGYMIYRADTIDGEFSEYKKVGSGKTSFTDKVNEGERYYYMLGTLAKDEEYNSELTGVLYTTAKLAKPENVNVINFLAASARVSWNEVADAKTYSVYRSLSENGLYSKIGTATSTEYVDTNVVANTEYFYKVVAENGNTRVTGDYSDVVSIIIEPKDWGEVNNLLLPNNSAGYVFPTGEKLKSEKLLVPVFD